MRGKRIVTYGYLGDVAKSLFHKTYSVPESHQLGWALTRPSDHLGIITVVGDLPPLVLSQAALVLTGNALGIALTLMLSRLLQNMIDQISPFDPLTFLSVGLMVIVVAMFACYLPARWPTRANPMTALRAEQPSTATPRFS
jgi:putative ABC transport system permease protein